MAGVDLVVVGSIGLDTIETPHEKGEDLLGGSVTYACAAASFFTRVGMVGVVGNDFPKEYEDLYAKFGIDLDGLEHAEGRTFRWSGVYDADMINRTTLATELNVFESFHPRLPEPYREAPFLLLGNISPELQLEVFSQVGETRFVAADTMDLWINVARGTLMEVIRRADLITLNDMEARLLTEEHSLRKCADTILGWGPSYVLIKKGEHGAMLFSGSKIFIVPAYPVVGVHDPTGAGDAFAGAAMGALAAHGSAEEHGMREALLYGAVVASFAVESFSLESLKRLDRQQIEERFGLLREMMSL